ncbi:TPA: type 1 fimbrial protein [Klebsiella aerogenes]|nr:type 1 fimbrial protein [Klebsiella aerogenes]
MTTSAFLLAKYQSTTPWDIPFLSAHSSRSFIFSEGGSAWYSATTGRRNTTSFFTDLPLPAVFHPQHTLGVAVIKTGPIELSSSLSISQDFPKVAMVLSTKTTYDPSAMKVVDFPQSGSIIITAATCETQDLTVDMGGHDVNKFIIGKGFTTVWKDASIVLKNCPTFSGYYANHYTGQVFSSKGGRASEPRAGRNPNILTVSLSALEPLIDTANQVIGLENIDNAATGVGVQLGYSTNIDANPITPQNIWQPGKSWDISPPSDERHSFKIPLAAPYYQVDNTVTPGVANAKIMFNIDYK